MGLVAEEQPVSFKLRIPQALAERINVFRHQNMIDTKSEAIIVLLEKALLSKEDSPAARRK